MIRVFVFLLFPVVALAGGNQNDNISNSNSSSVASAKASAGANVANQVTMNGGTVSGEVIGGDLTGANNSISDKSYALGLANSLGDVDIRDCLGSTQWSSPVYGRQKLVLNQVCMAEFYLEVQAYKLAAMSLCNVKEILKEFEDEAQCEAAHDFTPKVVYQEPEPDDRHEEQSLLLATLVEQVEVQGEMIHQQKREIERSAKNAAKRREQERQENLDFLNRYREITDDED